jgi:tetratricopeptide (TPR) repeat protein
MGDSTMTGDRSKAIETMRKRYLVEYRRSYRKNDRIAFFEEISETAAAADVLFWETFADAMSAWLRKDLGTALALAEKAIELDPEYSHPWNCKGNVLQSQKRYAEALAAYEQAIEREPDYADPWSGKGHVLQSQERHEEASLALEKATALKRNQGITLIEKDPRRLPALPSNSDSHVPKL